MNHEQLIMLYVFISIKSIKAPVHSPTMKQVPGLELRRTAITSASGAFPIHEIRKEPPFKKIRGVELKQFFDGKSFLRKKDDKDDDGENEEDKFGSLTGG